MNIDAADRPVDIAGYKFGIGQLSAMQQFHVSRRLAPLLGELGGALVVIAKSKAVREALNNEKLKSVTAQQAAELIDAYKEGEAATPPDNAPQGLLDDPQLLEIVSTVAKPLSVALANMSDADAEYVVNACLGVCKLRQGGVWAPVVGRNGQLMFQDIKMRTMLELTWRTIMENMGDFFSSPA